MQIPEFYKNFSQLRFFIHTNMYYFLLSCNLLFYMILSTLWECSESLKPCIRSSANFVNRLRKYCIIVRIG